jgi:hypothetical protein
MSGAKPIPMKLLVVFLVTGLSAFASVRQIEVNVVVDMTPEGRKREPPSPDHPTYYLPIVGGYRQEGTSFAGEKRPTQNALLHLAAVELANQSYFVCQPTKAHPPDIILVFNWGYMNPERATLPAPVLSHTEKDPGANGDSDDISVQFNDRQMLDLVGGAAIGNVKNDSDREQVAVRAEENRYFIAITAYDYAASIHSQKKVPLWQEKVSVPSQGVGYDDVAGALVAAAGPFFGRETVTPKQFSVPAVPEGRVLLGTPRITDDKDATPAPTGAK